MSLRPLVLRALAAFAAFAALAGMACGPSFQVVYEGDARFEHCYALDETPSVSMQEKTDCWSQWVSRYTYGQTRARADYATMRASALQEVHALPTDEAVMGAAPGGGTPGSRAVNEPAPTSAFVSPPTTIAEVDSGFVRPVAPSMSTSPATARPASPPVTGLPPPPPAAVPPKDDCVGACRLQWQTCKGACKAIACDKCDKSYGTCVKACFRAP